MLLAAEKYPLSFHIWTSCSVAFLAEGVIMSLFISDMAQTAEQKSDSAKAWLSGAAKRIKVP